MKITRQELGRVKEGAMVGCYYYHELNYGTKWLWFIQFSSDTTSSSMVLWVSPDPIISQC